jgi:DNA-binding response OmpR family regulator
MKQRRQDTDAGSPRKSPHIVVIDDSRFVLAHTRKNLEQLGFRVSAFTEPAELRSAPIDDAILVLVDVNIGPMLGDELIVELKQLARRALVLLVSSIPEAELRSRAAQAGAHGYLQKGPKFMAEIEGILRRLGHEAATARPGRTR